MFISSIEPVARRKGHVLSKQYGTNRTNLLHIQVSTTRTINGTEAEQNHNSYYSKMEKKCFPGLV
jgi:hypothetical protein